MRPLVHERCLNIGVTVVSIGLLPRPHGQCAFAYSAGVLLTGCIDNPNCTTLSVTTLLCNDKVATIGRPKRERQMILVKKGYGLQKRLGGVK
jgi:hypothetical protein